MADILQGIANPAIANVPGAIASGRQARIGREDRGREEETRRLAGDILKKTMGGKLGNLGKLNPQAAVELSQALGIPINEKGRIQSMIGDIQIAATIFESAGPQAAAEFAAEKASMLEGLGIQPTQYLETIQGLTSQDPAEVQQAGEALINLRDGFISQGLLKGPTSEVDKSVAENRKEIRSSVRGQIKTLRTEEGTISTNFRKIRELGGEIKKSNRSAVSQALVALVKIGDPTSVVRTSEAAAALNNPTILATLFTDTGTDSTLVDAAIRAIDPLNPGVLNIEDIQATADAMVLASVPGIQARFGDAKTEGGNLPQTTFKTIFSGRLEKRINALSDLVKPAPKATTTATPEQKRARLEELRRKKAQ